MKTNDEIGSICILICFKFHIQFSSKVSFSLVFARHSGFNQILQEISSFPIIRIAFYSLMIIIFLAKRRIKIAGNCWEEKKSHQPTEIGLILLGGLSKYGLIFQCFALLRQLQPFLIIGRQKAELKFELSKNFVFFFFFHLSKIPRKGHTSLIILSSQTMHGEKAIFRT